MKGNKRNSAEIPGGTTGESTSPPTIDIETIVDFEALRESKLFPGLDEEYPLREAADDPVWAVWTISVWFWIAWFCLMFIVTMLFLGALYD